jgi:DNA-binding beta-propeller fold protein YncE
MPRGVLMKRLIKSIASLILASCCGLASAATHNYAISTEPGGIQVLNISGDSAAVEPGSPYTPNPVPTDFSDNAQPQPNLIAVDPTSTYVYALYGSDTYPNFDGSPVSVYSFRLSSGKLVELSRVQNIVGSCCEGQTESYAMVATSHYVFFISNATYGSQYGGYVSILKSSGGYLSLAQTYELRFYNSQYGINDPVGLVVDPAEHYMYVTYNTSANYEIFDSCTATQCMAIYDITSLPSGTPKLISITPNVEGTMFTAP